MLIPFFPVPSLCSIEHIIGNLVLQLVLGIPLELVHKGHRVGLVYLAGVVGGEGMQGGLAADLT